MQFLSARGTATETVVPVSFWRWVQSRTPPCCGRTNLPPAGFGSHMPRSIDLTQGRVLLDSYHCSRYNTQTRRLTTEMFESVIERARALAQ